MASQEGWAVELGVGGAKSCRGRKKSALMKHASLSRFPSAPPLKSAGLDQCGPEAVSIDAIITMG